MKITFPFLFSFAALLCLSFASTVRADSSTLVCNVTNRWDQCTTSFVVSTIDPRVGTQVTMAEYIGELAINPDATASPFCLHTADSDKAYNKAMSVAQGLNTAGICGIVIDSTYY